VEGKSWSPSLPPPDFGISGSGASTPARPSSAQSSRKPRTSARAATSSSLRQNSASPAPYKDATPPLDRNSPRGSPAPTDSKSANEAFFATLGAANADRPEDLPPSQGGRYQGFGSAPSPSAQNPALGLSSANAPTLAELQENPAVALTKGWSLFSSVVAGATRVVNESVIQPGLEKVRDPNLHASVQGYVSGAARRANTLGLTANEWSRQRLGVDIAGSVGGVYDTVKDRVNGPGHEGYGALATEHDADWDNARYNDGDDFFHEFDQSPTGHNEAIHSTTAASSTAAAPAKKADDWDDWKDF